MVYSWLNFLLVFSFKALPIMNAIPNSDLYMELARSRGYPIETHEVETEDGYLLTVYRIPHGRDPAVRGTPNRYPVLTQHGMFGCGENVFWLNKSFGYELADNGYDLWSMNVRGSWHSVKHKTLDPHKDDAYWRFTWHEIGFYDIPSTIDYILNNTGAQNLSYIGHSQGTTAMFVMGATRPQYNHKVNGMVAMGPSTVMINPRSLQFRILAKFYKVFKAIGDFFNIQKFPPFLSNTEMHAINQFLCGKRFSFRRICKYFIADSIGDDQYDAGILPITSALTPSTASYHQMIHYGQTISNGKFATFDWGNPEENLRRYGSEKPVEYNVTNISFKVALYIAQNDIYVSNQAIQLLDSTLPNISEEYTVPYKAWSHIDFLWARDLDIYLNPKLLQTLNGFTQH